MALLSLTRTSSITLILRRKIDMAFRLRKDADVWFKHLRKQLKIDFDEYYFCLMAGLASNRKTSPNEIPNDETRELVQHFPGEYKTKGKLIVAQFLVTELKEHGIDLKDRSAVNTTINKLIDPLSVSHLSSEGEATMNRYAHGGFETLTEWFDDQPWTLEIFLPLFRKKLQVEINGH